MTAVSVGASGFAVDGASPTWGAFAGARDPLVAAARTLLGARNPRLSRLDRGTLAALVAAHLLLERSVAPHVLVVAVDEGCTATDRAFWKSARGRGGLDASPSRFAATLPSTVAGELAMTFGLRGPCVVLAGRGASEACGETAGSLVAAQGDSPCMVVQLRGWDGDADGEARATSESSGEFRK